jgi:hypothetical protein
VTVVDRSGQRAGLLRNRAVHEARLQGLDAAARRKAEKLARSASDLVPSFGRHASDWSRRHEARFQAELAVIIGEQRGDRQSLERKIERRSEALRRIILTEARTQRRPGPLE